MFELAGAGTFARARASLCLRAIVRAYAPGAFKLLTSPDGANFEESENWRAPSQSAVSFDEVVMLGAAQNVQAGVCPGARSRLLARPTGLSANLLSVYAAAAEHV